MKKTIIFCIVFNCCTIGVYAQVCTPIGTSVDYHNDPVGLPDDIAGWEADAAAWISVNINPQEQYVSRIDPADGSYNCHGYAWHVEHNGNNDVVYAYLDDDLDEFDREDEYDTPPPPDNIKKYWDDGSYVLTTQSLAQKVWYGSCWEWDPGAGKHLDWCNHSAVIYNGPSGIYESKWGKWPLYRHDYDACPYDYSERQYYKLDLSVSGDFLLCTSNKEYTLNDDPDGTITWSVSPSNKTTPSSGSGNPAIIKASSGSVYGYCYITYNLTTCGNASYQITSDSFWVGKFHTTVVTGQAAVCPDELYTYTAHPPGGHDPVYEYDWTYPGNWIWQWEMENWIRLKTAKYDPDYGTVRVEITNECGESNPSGITVYPGYCGGYYMAFPNPSSSYVDIDVNPKMSTLIEEIYNNDISLSVYNKMGIVVLNSNVESLPYRIDTSGLPNGEYVVKIITGKKDGTEKDQRFESLKITVNH